ncbi:MAG: hypothetical protein ABR946_09110 [Solirubrobacteraceae bacterium]|jgi:hypothetical protein
MTDVMTRLAAANPVAAEEETSAGVLTGALERVRVAPGRATRRDAQPRLVRGGFALAGTAGAAAVGVLVLSAGTVTPTAEAFPILRGPATDISRLIHIRAAADSAPGALAGFSAPGSFLSALQDAHAFAVPNVSGLEMGYVVESPNDQTLCLTIARQLNYTGSPGTITSGTVDCDPASTAEQAGFVTSVPTGSEDAFAAIVPAGATVSLTEDGTTTPVSVDDGIATGVVPDTATLTIDVAGTSTSYPVSTAPSNKVWAWSTRTNAGPTGPIGSSAPVGASGSTVASGPTN